MSCKCVTNAISIPTCKTGCILGGVHIVYPQNSVGRCGQEGVIDLTAMSTHSRNVTECKNGNAISYKLDKWADSFESVTRDGNSLIYVFKTDAEIGVSHKIRFVAKCSDGRGAYGEILVFVKDICSTLNCNGNQVCDECTETCIDAPMDLQT